MRVFLAHQIKWPMLVRPWAVLAADSTTAPDLVANYMDTLRSVHNQAFPRMHEAMSSPRMHSTTGVLVGAKHLNLVVSAQKYQKMKTHKRPAVTDEAPM